MFRGAERELRLSMFFKFLRPQRTRAREHTPARSDEAEREQAGERRKDDQDLDHADFVPHLKHLLVWNRIA